MQLDFPTSPAPNQVYSLNGKSWKWNGDAWETYNDNLGVDFVETVNGATGEIDVVGGTDISVSTAGKTVTVNYTGSSTSNAVTSFNGRTGAVQGVGAFMGKTGAVGISAYGGAGITYSLTGNTYAFGIHYTTTGVPVNTSVNSNDSMLLESKGGSKNLYQITAGNFATYVLGLIPTPTLPTIIDDPTSSTFLLTNNTAVTWADLIGTITDTTVTSFNGLTGDVYGVSKVNGLTGDVTISTVDFVDGGTFT